FARWEAPPKQSAPASMGPNSPAVQPPTPEDGLTQSALARLEARLDELGQRPTPADEPTRSALARLEARLGQLGQRPGEGLPRPDGGAPQLPQLRSDRDRLKHELESASRAGKQEIQELSLAVREVLDLLRRLAMQSRMPEPLPVPVPIPVLPQGRLPG